MRHYLHILIILAFILSGISPACAFISGKASLDVEICTADGIKIVKMPSSEQAPDDSDHAHQKKSDCGFCFAQSHLKLAKVDPVVLSIAQNTHTDKITQRVSTHIVRFELSTLHPRAPPLA